MNRIIEQADRLIAVKQEQTYRGLLRIREVENGIRPNIIQRGINYGRDTGIKIRH